MHKLYKYLDDKGIYLVDPESEITFEDRYVDVHIRKDEIYCKALVTPSVRSQFKRVKVIWYYEKPGTDNTSLYKDLESELIGMLSEEITREINREIMNTIRLQNP